tara:strand:+ start:3804 stop:4097 length:294 start_codon:yes stop_codon:yes gene_type:complete
MLISLDSEYIDSASTPLINKDMELNKIIIKIKIMIGLLSIKKLMEIFLYAENKKNPRIKIDKYTYLIDKTGSLVLNDTISGKEARKNCMYFFNLLQY